MGVLAGAAPFIPFLRPYPVITFLTAFSSVEKVLSHLQRIGSGKSSGPDNLPNWVLKSFADLHAEPVTVILNASFREERLPSVWKLANVCPIPKNKVVLDVNKDLRAISLTSSLTSDF
jgi:hypothetical protein